MKNKIQDTHEKVDKTTKNTQKLEEVQKTVSVDTDFIQQKIYFIRGEKVMVDRDLAVLYGVPTKVLKQSIKRNSERFPLDFMFELSIEELDNWRSQFVTSNSSLKQGLRIPPLVFTEQGIAMLSSVLNSPRAILVNIQIIRLFTKLRRMIDTYKELREKVEALEKNSDANFKEIFRVIRLLITQEEQPKGKMGFRVD